MTDDLDLDWPHGHMSGDYPARIVCRDAKGDYPIVAMVLEDGVELPYTFTRSGRHCLDGVSSKIDLRNAPEPKKRIKGWVNISPNGYMSQIYPSREVADSNSYTYRRACIRIDVEEGEGL